MEGGAGDRRGRQGPPWARELLGACPRVLARASVVIGATLFTQSPSLQLESGFTDPRQLVTQALG